jgi:glycosyltransferase involved in cell wall biosynthesis
LKFERAICISHTSRKELVDAGIPVSSARVIYNGIDAERFLNQTKNSTQNNERNIFRLVLIGRIVPEKGIETAVQALEVLRADTNIDGKISLTIAGSGKFEFEEYLRGLVVRAGLNEQVSFKGQIPYEEIPSFLGRFDALIFPSIWVEPFGRVILESMVSGLVVIATSRGGPSEVITHGENGLLFEPGNPEVLAEEIKYLIEDKVLHSNLACAGRKTVLEKFTRDRMVGDIEAYLHEVASSQ